MKADIDTYLDHLKKGINQGKKNLGKTAYKELLSTSPVRLGSYVKSHKIGIGAVDSTHEPVYTVKDPGNIPAKMPKAMVTALKKSLYAQGIAKLAKVPFEKDIFISNSIPYADQVEFIGWDKTGPYAVYGKTILRLQAKKFLQLQADL